MKKKKNVKNLEIEEQRKKKQKKRKTEKKSPLLFMEKILIRYFGKPKIGRYKRQGGNVSFVESI